MRFSAASGDGDKGIKQKALGDTVKRLAGASLGLSVASNHNFAGDPTPTSHAVHWLVPGGATEVADTKVKVGDTIIAIDGAFVARKSHEDVSALTVFKAAGTTIELSLFARQVRPSKYYTFNMSVSNLTGSSQVKNKRLIR
jgi:C-terminal processing protease CtpA/Prc